MAGVMKTVINRFRCIPQLLVSMLHVNWDVSYFLWYIYFSALSSHTVNECAVNKGGCEHSCHDTPNGFFCRCHHGYVLDPSNRRSCVGKGGRVGGREGGREGGWEGGREGGREGMREGRRMKELGVDR